MLLASALVAFIATSSCDAFVPSPSFTTNARISSQLSLMDPSAFHDLPSHIESIQSAFSSLMISDEDIAAVATAASDVATAASNAAADVATNAGDAVDAAATANDNGWFGFLVGPIEGLLQIIHSVLVSVGLNANAWGVSIVALTLVIKLLTYPLTKTQLESTTKMQMLQPKVKEIQTKYASNPEVMNQKVSEVYQTNEVNPLAGCFPAIVQLPVFIGLYRAVLTLAKENKLNEPFLWLPNLEGPTYGADPATATSWLTGGWVDGAPSLGWGDTIAFLTIPVFLVISTSLSQKLSSPKNPTPEQEAQQNNIVLKVLPLLFGWFSISVPAGLGVYWVTNNLVTTLLTLQIKSSLEANPPAVGASGGGAATSVVDTPVSSFTPAPMREKPSGFAAPATASPDEVTPITPIDAEVVESVAEDSSGDAPMAPPRPKKKKRKGKKKKN